MLCQQISSAPNLGVCFFSQLLNSLTKVTSYSQFTAISMKLVAMIRVCSLYNLLTIFGGDIYSYISPVVLNSQTDPTTFTPPNPPENTKHTFYMFSPRRKMIRYSFAQAFLIIFNLVFYQIGFKSIKEIFLIFLCFQSVYGVIHIM